MTIIWSNNASTTIAGSITATDTTVALAAGTGILFPNPTGGDYYVATFYDQATKTQNEIVHVTGMAGDVATIERGQEGTDPQAWNAGDIFANLITAGTLDAFVQAGTGPADTSLVYVGDDISTDPAHIVATTNPVPANFAVGMLFNIRVGTAWPAGIYTNAKDVDLQLNGTPAVLAKMTDGANFSSNLMFKNLEYIFIYNGTNFSSTLMRVPQKPPQLTFYIRSDSTSIVDMNPASPTAGLESNSGLANTPTEAFKTIQGAANTIAARYISTERIKLIVADGTYTSGLYHSSQYISGFELQGNDSNPQNCVIDCRSTTLSSYVPGSGPGCIGVGKNGNIVAHGFTLQSYSCNATTSGGRLELYHMNFNGPTSGHTSCIAAVTGGSCLVWGNCSYASNVGGQYIFEAAYSGSLSIGAASDFAEDTRVLNWDYIGTVSGWAGFLAHNSAVISVANRTGVVNVTGNKLAAREYYAQFGGGIGFLNPIPSGLFATVPGVTYAPGWNVNGNG
jgi:hypothetical protein